jgi:cyclophilin family peptidyl-prolyl cis-trans isomerase
MMLFSKPLKSIYFEVKGITIAFRSFFPGIISAFVFLYGCTSSDSFRFDDPNFVKIAEFQDRGLTDSIYYFFKSSNSNYRAAAALAFASIKDTSASQALGNLLLEDPDTSVRINAAFALGQTGGITSVNALIPALQDKDPSVVREVLEALGKTVKKNDLMILQQYIPTYAVTQEGFAWALYRIGLRGMADSIVIEKEMKFLDSSHSEKTRLGAASFFGRSPLKGNRFEATLIHAALTDPSPDVRMASVSGLKKLKSATAFDALSTILKKEKDYRVRINAVRALAGFDPDMAKPLYLMMLKDPEVNVGIAASETVRNVMKNPLPEIIEAAENSGNWRIQANLYKAILTTDPSGSQMKEVKKLFNSSLNNYQKAWLLGAIASDYKEYTFISDVLLNSTIPVIKSAAADALVGINYSNGFPPDLKSSLADIYKACIKNGDPAVVGIICGALADTAQNYKKEYKDVSFLLEAKNKMVLPKDIESLQPLENAIAYFNGTKRSTLKSNWNHPIPWGLLKSVKGREKAVVKTSKGEIVMRLRTREAPGSVANFVSLVKQNYFDGKFFHRTVPNFVIQTGCNRGDGYGSEDYSIRSEFSRRNYTRGSVGMASAGKDTEGTQWFITHSPTPHLDGRYTIFANVEKGMEVVDHMEVGDQIISVVLD